MTKRARRRTRQRRPGATALGVAVDQSAAQKGGATVGRIGDASVRSGGGGWGGLDVGDSRQARWRRKRRRQRYKTAATLAGVPSSPLPFHGNPKSGFPGPLSWSHGEVTSDYRFSLLHSSKNHLHDTPSSLPYIGERKRRVALRAIP